MDINVRDAAIDDLEGILNIERGSFEFPWSERMFINQLQLKNIAAVLVAEADSTVVGYAIVWFENHDSHILNIAVSPDFRKRGVGNRIVDEVVKRSREKNCRRLYLEVRRRNRRARDFYLGRGFTVKKMVEGYYQENGEDALVLELSLD